MGFDSRQWLAILYRLSQAAGDRQERTLIGSGHCLVGEPAGGR